MNTRRAGMTLFELLIVVVVMGALATLAIPQLAHRAESAAATITRHTLAEVRQSIVSQYVPDMFEELPGPADPTRAAHPQLAYLYLNPLHFTPTQIGDQQWTYNAQSKRGWSGPYLKSGGLYAVDTATNNTTRYGETGDPAPLDGWGRPIVIQQPVPSELGSGWSRTNTRYARLVSGGPDGVINTPPDVYEPIAAECGDDLVLFLVRPQDPEEEE